jgi:hypothetical protein
LAASNNATHNPLTSTWPCHVHLVEISHDPQILIIGQSLRRLADFQKCSVWLKDKEGHLKNVQASNKTMKISPFETGN